MLLVTPCLMPYQPHKSKENSPIYQYQYPMPESLNTSICIWRALERMKCMYWDGRRADLLQSTLFSPATDFPSKRNHTPQKSGKLLSWGDLSASAIPYSRSLSLPVQLVLQGKRKNAVPPGSGDNAKYRHKKRHYPPDVKPACWV